MRASLALPAERIREGKDLRWSEYGNTKGFQYMSKLFTWLQDSRIGFWIWTAKTNS